MKKYENAANSRNFNNVQKLVSDDSVFWFTDDPFTGSESIMSAFEKTWNTMGDEEYSIKNLNWVYDGDVCAVCVQICIQRHHQRSSFKVTRERHHCSKQD